MSSSSADATAAVGYRRAVALAQSRICADASGPTWAAILRAAAFDLDGSPPGPLGRLLLDDPADPARSNAPLRLVGALHRTALVDEACPLRAWLPSTGGIVDPEQAVAAARVVAADDPEGLRVAMSAPVQTNEVGRAAVLSAALHASVRRHPRPVRLLDIGASAGLNLVLDRYRIESDGAAWGPPESPVRLVDRFVGRAPEPADLVIAERRGCDPDPVDLTSPAGRVLLRSFVWPERTDRLALLDAAIETVRHDPPRVDRSAANAWLPGLIADPVPGLLTIVMHSAVTPYVAADEWAEVEAAIATAGAAATETAPFAHLSFEAILDVEPLVVEVAVQSWPGGERRVLATCGPHGDDIVWLGDGSS